MKKLKSFCVTVFVILSVLAACLSMASAEPDQSAVTSSAGSSTAASSDGDEEGGTDTETENSATDKIETEDIGQAPDIGQQGTEGDELHVEQTSHIEIYLGEEYKGLQFTLITDAGEYPEPVTVDADGIITMDLGSSSSYELRNTGNYSGSNSTQEGMVDENGEFANPFAEEETNKPGIPVWVIFVLGAGIVLSVIALILTRKKKDNESPDEDFEAAVIGRTDFGDTADTEETDDDEME